MTSNYLRQNGISLDVKLANLIDSFKFNCVGTVQKVNTDGTRIDVVLPSLDANFKPLILKGIEVLRPGTRAVKVVYSPKIGDVALVFSQYAYWDSAKFANVPTPAGVAASPYSEPTMKAILVQTNEENPAATLIEITDTDVNIKTPLALNITCEKALTLEAKDAVTLTCDSTADVTCKGATTVTAQDTVDITCEKAATLTAKDTADITCEKAATLTAKDALSVSASKELKVDASDKLTISAKGDVSIDASGKNVSIKSAKATINNHLEVI